MGNTHLRLEFGLQSDLFWDPLAEEHVRAAFEKGFSFFEIWGHVPWFDLYSPSMAGETRKVAEDNGMRIRSVHAPCEADWDISSEDGSIRKKSVHEVILSIENCRKMNGELIVVHPGRAVGGAGEPGRTEFERRLRKSIQSFTDIQRAAADNGIRIAVENQWSNEVGSREPDFLRLLDTLDPETAGICFDSSHANITPGTLEMFQRIRFPIITTHLADNHGRYDEHLPPFLGLVDWPGVVRLILENGYGGPWLLEVTNGGNDPFGVLEQMGASTQKLKKLIPEINKTF